MEPTLSDITYKRLIELERRVNTYFEQYQTKNELDFVLCGGYFFDEDLACILDGTYELEV